MKQRRDAPWVAIVLLAALLLCGGCAADRTARSSAEGRGGSVSGLILDRNGNLLGLLGSMSRGAERDREQVLEAQRGQAERERQAESARERQAAQAAAVEAADRVGTAPSAAPEAADAPRPRPSARPKRAARRTGAVSGAPAEAVVREPEPVEAAPQPSTAAALPLPAPAAGPLPPADGLASSAFHIPSPIRIDQTVVAQLRIDPGKDLAAVRAALAEATSDRPGELRAAAVAFAPRMRAELKSDEQALRIRANSPTDQAVMAGETTVWTWSVTGLAPGRHELIVTLLKLLEDGRQRTVPTPVFSVTVTVPEQGLVARITGWIEQLTGLAGALQALAAAVLALLATLGIVKVRQRGKARADAEDG